MHKNVCLLVTTLAFGATSVTCSSVEVCFAGHQVACDCPGGEQGIQVCQTDGSGLGACMCSSTTSTSSATTSGNGGAGGSSSCIPGTQIPCYDGPLGTQNVGTCKAGVQTCKPDGTGYGLCEGEVLPAPDKCSTPEDEDCNGSPMPCVSDVVWGEHFGSSGHGSAGQHLAIDAAGNIIVLMSSDGVDLGSGPLSGLVAVKFDASGSVLWAKGFGATASWSGVAVDTTGNILVTGFHTGTIDFGGGPLVSTGGQEAFVAKLSPSGAHLWSKDFGGATSYGESIGVDAQGNVVFGGQFIGSITFGGTTLKSADLQGDLFLVKLDPTGAHLWSKQGHAHGGAMVQSVSPDTAGNLVVSGWFADGLDWGSGPLTGKGESDLFVAKLDGTGAPVFTKQFGDSATQQECSSAIDAAGNIALTGRFEGTIKFGGGSVTATSSTVPDVFLAKLDAMGNHVWSRSFGNGQAQVVGGVAFDTPGNLMFIGGFQGALDFGTGTLTSAGGYDAFLAQYAPSGAAAWTKRFGDAQTQLGLAVAITSTGASIITGTFGGAVDFGAGSMAASGQQDAFLVELAP